MSFQMWKKVFGLTMVSTIATLGCMQSDQQAQAPGPQISKGIAVIHATDGNEVSGTVMFMKVEEGIRVVANITGLPAGEHGFHIHQYGDCSAPDGTSTGGHFNPGSKRHGGPEAAERHIGDLGNIVADESGNATLERVDTHLALNGPNSIIGRGIIIHAGTDDLTTQPTGAAGAHLGCGVIGVAQGGD